MRSFGKHSLFFNAFKESACQAGDMGLIPGLGRPPGEGNSNPLQYSCPRNHKDRGGWRATVHGGRKMSHDLATKTISKCAWDSGKGSEALKFLYLHVLV